MSPEFESPGDKVVIRRFDPSGEKTEGFVVMPNQAMSWHTLVLLYLLIASVTLCVGVFFYWHGYKLVLPFSGLEVVLLGVALYVTAWRGGEQEVILFTEDTILFERGHRTPEESYRFQRAWAKIVLERSWNSWYPSRLLLRSHGRQIEIGRFLNEQERQGLAGLLQAVVSRKHEPPDKKITQKT